MHLSKCCQLRHMTRSGLYWGREKTGKNICRLHMLRTGFQFALDFCMFSLLPPCTARASPAVHTDAARVQVRLEEKHLLGLHGSAYEQYFSEVPRWL